MFMVSSSILAGAKLLSRVVASIPTLPLCDNNSVSYCFMLFLTLISYLFFLPNFDDWKTVLCFNLHFPDYLRN